MTGHTLATDVGGVAGALSRLLDTGARTSPHYLPDRKNMSEEELAQLTAAWQRVVEWSMMTSG